MNAYAMAQRAYAPTGAPTRSERSIEYDVIARVTSRLKKAVVEKNYPNMMEALHENARLWRTLAIDVADAGNGLPKDLRARVFYLAEFTDHHTKRVIRENISAKPLLEINMAILRGLKHAGSSS
ncbi:MAG: flagellar biosynthesis regulator FlaF [Pseudomonadota bacterium]